MSVNRRKLLLAGSQESNVGLFGGLEISPANMWTLGDGLYPVDLMPGGQSSEDIYGVHKDTSASGPKNLFSAGEILKIFDHTPDPSTDINGVPTVFAVQNLYSVSNKDSALGPIYTQGIYNNYYIISAHGGNPERAEWADVNLDWRLPDSWEWNLILFGSYYKSLATIEVVQRPGCTIVNQQGTYGPIYSKFVCVGQNNVADLTKINGFLIFPDGIIYANDNINWGNQPDYGASGSGAINTIIAQNEADFKSLISTYTDNGCAFLQNYGVIFTRSSDIHTVPSSSFYFNTNLHRHGTASSGDGNVYMANLWGSSYITTLNTQFGDICNWNFDIAGTYRLHDSLSSTTDDFNFDEFYGNVRLIRGTAITS